MPEILESPFTEGDIITIDGWCQAPYNRKTPDKSKIKPLPIKFTNGALGMMLDEGYAPVMVSTSKNGGWRFTGREFVLGGKHA